MKTILSADNLRAYYITGAYGVKRTVRAVEDISIAIRENEIYGIAGESGCGKSTLLKVLLGEVEPPLTVLQGAVTYHLNGDAIDALHIPKSQLSSIRWKEVAYIPQGSMHVLNPVRRIRDSFRDFVMAHSPRSKEETDALVLEYINRLGLPDSPRLALQISVRRGAAPTHHHRPGDDPAPAAGLCRRTDDRPRRGGSKGRDPASARSAGPGEKHDGGRHA